MIINNLLLPYAKDKKGEMGMKRTAFFVFSVVFPIFLFFAAVPSISWALEDKLKDWCQLTGKNGTFMEEFLETVKNIKVTKKAAAVLAKDIKALKNEVLWKNLIPQQLCWRSRSFKDFSSGFQKLSSQFNSEKDKNDRIKIVIKISDLKNKLGGNYIPGLIGTKKNADDLKVIIKAFKNKYKGPLRKKDYKKLKAVLDKLKKGATDAKNVAAKLEQDSTALYRQASIMMNLFDDEIDAMP